MANDYLYSELKEYCSGDLQEMKELLDNLIQAYIMAYTNKAELPSWDLICKTNMELANEEAKEEYRSRIKEITK